MHAGIWCISVTSLPSSVGAMLVQLFFAVRNVSNVLRVSEASEKRHIQARSDNLSSNTLCAHIRSPHAQFAEFVAFYFRHLPVNKHQTSERSLQVSQIMLFRHQKPTILNDSITYLPNMALFGNLACCLEPFSLYKRAKRVTDKTLNRHHDFPVEFEDSQPPPCPNVIWASLCWHTGWRCTLLETILFLDFMRERSERERKKNVYENVL